MGTGPGGDGKPRRGGAAHESGGGYDEHGEQTARDEPGGGFLRAWTMPQAQQESSLR